MIVAHHGAELPLILTLAVGTGAPLLVLARGQLAAATMWLRRSLRRR